MQSSLACHDATMPIYFCVVIYSYATNPPENTEVFLSLSKSQPVAKTKDIAGEIRY